MSGVQLVQEGDGVRITGTPAEPQIGLVVGVRIVHTNYAMTRNDDTIIVTPQAAPTVTITLPRALEVEGRKFVIQRVVGGPDANYAQFVRIRAHSGDTLGPRSGNTVRYLSTGSEQLIVQAAARGSAGHWIIVNTDPRVYDILDFGADPTGETDSQPACQAASDAASRGYGVVIVFAPEGMFALARPWTIVGGLGRSVVVEGMGPGDRNGTHFMPHPDGFSPKVTDPTDARSPVWNLTGQYYAPQRYDLLGYRVFQSTTDGVIGHESQVDYKPLIRTRKLNQGSYLRNFSVSGVGLDNFTARCGKGIWVDWWFENEVDASGYTPSNGLRLENITVSRCTDVLDDTFPAIPAFAIQVGAFDQTGPNYTLQAADVRMLNLQVLGGAPSPAGAVRRTDVGIWYHTGNVKNFVVADSNVGFCRYGIRTAGSGYFLITGCDVTANGRREEGWDDGADYLVPPGNVQIVGCGSEGSRRCVQGEGGPMGFGALNVDASYWDSASLAFDLGTSGEGGIGHVFNNVNQATSIRGVRVVTYGGWNGARADSGVSEAQSFTGAPTASISLGINQFVLGALTLDGSHLDGVGSELGDPPIYVGDNLLPVVLGLNNGWDENESYRFTVRHCTSRTYPLQGTPGVDATAVAAPPVHLQCYEHGSVRRIGGHSTKVQIKGASQSPFALQAWNHTVVGDVEAGPVTLVLPPAATCRGREYVLKRSGSPWANAMILVATPGDTIEGATEVILDVPFGYRRLVSDGVATWLVTGA